MFIILYIVKDIFYNLRKKVKYIIRLLNFTSACYLSWFILRSSHNQGSFYYQWYVLLNFLRSLFYHLENTTVKILLLGPFQKRNTVMNRLGLKKKVFSKMCQKVHLFRWRYLPPRDLLANTWISNLNRDIQTLKWVALVLLTWKQKLRKKLAEL